LQKVLGGLLFLTHTVHCDCSCVWSVHSQSRCGVHGCQASAGHTVWCDTRDEFSSSVSKHSVWPCQQHCSRCHAGGLLTSNTYLLKLWTPGAKFTDIVLRFILRYVTRSS